VSSDEAYVVAVVGERDGQGRARLPRSENGHSSHRRVRDLGLSMVVAVNRVISGKRQHDGDNAQHLSRVLDVFMATPFDRSIAPPYKAQPTSAEYRRGR
jgi:hypothetical protein